MRLLIICADVSFTHLCCNTFVHCTTSVGATCEVFSVFVMSLFFSHYMWWACLLALCGYIRLLLPVHFVIDGGGVSWRRTIFVDRMHAYAITILDMD